VRILESIRKRIVEGTVYSFGAMVLTKMILVINSIAIARILGRANLGILTILNNLTGIMLLFSIYSLPPAVVKFVAEYDKKDRGKLD